MLTDGNSLLGEMEIEKLTLLRINREFMKYMRTNYGHLTREEAKKVAGKAGSSSQGGQQPGGQSPAQQVGNTPPPDVCADARACGGRARWHVCAAQPVCHVAWHLAAAMDW